MYFQGRDQRATRGRPMIKCPAAARLPGRPTTGSSARCGAADWRNTLKNERRARRGGTTLARAGSVTVQRRAQDTGHHQLDR